MLRWQTRLDEAVEVYNTMLKTAETVGDMVAQARAWIGLSDAQNNKGEIQTALQSAQKAEEIAREVEEVARAELAEALGNRAWIMWRVGELQASIATAEEALTLSTEINLVREIAHSNGTLGIARFLLGEDMAVVSSHAQQAVDLYRQLGDRRGAAIELNNLAEFARLRGKYPEAIAYYEDVLPEFQAIGFQEGELAVLTNMAGAHIGQEEYAAAAISLRRVVDLTNGKDWWGLSEAYRFMAELRLAENKPTDAVEWAQKALAEGQKTGIGEFIGKGWRILGIVTARLTEPVAANNRTYTPAECFEESLQVFKDADAERAHTCVAWAEYEQTQGSAEKAQQLKQEAGGIFARLGME
jgi:tetratricopeptide (TPR) repeat protein